jgi:SAM-dependent methyltransferase
MSAATPTIVPVDACPLCGAQTSRGRDRGGGRARGGPLRRLRAGPRDRAVLGAIPERGFLCRPGRARRDGREAVRPAAARKRRNVALYDRLSRGQIGRPRPGARALDIGCNTGLLLDVLRELGYHTEGIERSPAGEVALAAGHVVHALDIEAHELGLPRYDLITLTHVLEHLRRPVAGPGVGPAPPRAGRRGGGRGAELGRQDAAAVGAPLPTARARRPRQLLRAGDAAGNAAEKAGLTVLQMWSAPQAGYAGGAEFAHGPRPGARSCGPRCEVVGGRRSPAAGRGWDGGWDGGRGWRRSAPGGQRQPGRAPAAQPDPGWCSPPSMASIRPWSACSGPECPWGANLVAVLARPRIMRGLGRWSGCVGSGSCARDEVAARSGLTRATRFQHAPGPVGPQSRRGNGVVVKSVITPACHVGGRGFESRPPRSEEARANPSGFFF